jgi:hypothetical protein
MKQNKNKMNQLSFKVKGILFILCAQDRHHDTCPQSFQLQNDDHSRTTLRGSSKEKYVGWTLC